MKINESSVEEKCNILKHVKMRRFLVFIHWARLFKLCLCYEFILGMAFSTFVLSPARLHLNKETEACILIVRHKTSFHLNPTIRGTDDKDTKGVDLDIIYISFIKKEKKNYLIYLIIFLPFR